jgi:hypothetical protein
VGGQHHVPAVLPPGNPVPIVQEARWAPGPVWTCAKNLTPTGNFLSILIQTLYPQQTPTLQYNLLQNMRAKSLMRLPQSRQRKAKPLHSENIQIITNSPLPFGTLTHVSPSPLEVGTVILQRLSMLFPQPVVGKVGHSPCHCHTTLWWPNDVVRAPRPSIRDHRVTDS